MAMAKCRNPFEARAEDWYQFFSSPKKNFASMLDVEKHLFFSQNEKENSWR
jgi:hypothetical protein